MSALLSNVVTRCFSAGDSEGVSCHFIRVVANLLSVVHDLHLFLLIPIRTYPTQRKVDITSPYTRWS